MKSRTILFTLVLAFVLGFSFAATVPAQTYVGDAICQGCHEDFPYTGFFSAYRSSGHPWPLVYTNGSAPAPATWPVTPSPPLPIAYAVQLQWVDVSYVIGNYFWKAQFIDRDGYIWTGDVGDETQWNLASQQFVPNNPGQTEPYDCGRCHTTGYSPVGNQNSQPGLVGVWNQDGVRCEACHGPGSAHAAAPSSTPTPGGLDCAACHTRDPALRMPWTSGFMRNHQQAEDLSHSPHAGFACIDCHNPHRSTVFAGGGVITQCTDCHPGDEANNFYVVREMPTLECIDCHMPFMGLSADARNEYTGDLRGHLFRITTNPIFAADNTYLDGGGEYWNQDLDGSSWMTLDYACLGCHLDTVIPLDMNDASAVAQIVHRSIPVSVPEHDPTIKVMLGQNAPNPFTGSTTIEFTLTEAQPARLVVYDAAGRTVRLLMDGLAKAGHNRVSWDGTNGEGDRVAGGMYFYKLTSGTVESIKKMVYLE